MPNSEQVGQWRKPTSISRSCLACRSTISNIGGSDGCADAALVPIIHPSRIDRYLVGAGGSWLSIRFDQIATISLDGIQLSNEKLYPYHADEYMLRLQRDLLDQQIIDVNGRKVVRGHGCKFRSSARGQGFPRHPRSGCRDSQHFAAAAAGYRTPAVGAESTAPHQPELHPVATFATSWKPIRCGGCG